jgi:hypothetical protein
LKIPKPASTWFSRRRAVPDRFDGVKPPRVHVPAAEGVYQSKRSQIYLRGYRELLVRPVAGLEPEATLKRGTEIIEHLRLPGIGHPQWWIGVGTALGFSRERGFIPHDTDIDVRVALDYRKLRRALRAMATIVRVMEENGFQLVREMYWSMRPMQSAFIDLRNHDIIFDVYYFYSHHTPGHYVNFNTEGLREKPERFVDGIRPEPWPGRPDIRVNVPQPIEEYNSWRWGPDWRIPKRNSELTERDLQCIQPLPNP